MTASRLRLLFASWLQKFKRKWRLEFFFFFCKGWRDLLCVLFRVTYTKIRYSTHAQELKWRKFKLTLGIRRRRWWLCSPCRYWAQVKTQQQQHHRNHKRNGNDTKERERDNNNTHTHTHKSVRTRRESKECVRVPMTTTEWLNGLLTQPNKRGLSLSESLSLEFPFTTWWEESRSRAHYVDILPSSLLLSSRISHLSSKKELLTTK